MFLFGGQSNENNVQRCLNDLYVLAPRPDGGYAWEIPTTLGEAPSPRESHTACAYFDKIKERHL